MLHQLAKFVRKKRVQLFSDATILVASSYLMFKKFFDISISNWLLTHLLNKNGVSIYVVAFGLVLLTAIVLKLLVLILDHFSPAKHSSVEPDEISTCLLAVNREIGAHLLKLDTESPVNIRDLRELHQFDINIRMIVDALAEHLRRCVKAISIKRKDIFISLYTHELTTNSAQLKYELHFDHKRDLVQSKTINLNDARFSGYECVKCMKSTNSTAYVLEKEAYGKGHSKRHKTVEQYMGCKLETEGRVFGFLNIEFHNVRVFSSQEDMEDFMEENVFPFKLLIEYQYLKRHFFGKFENFEANWRLA